MYEWLWQHLFCFWLVYFEHISFLCSVFIDFVFTFSAAASHLPTPWMPMAMTTSMVRALNLSLSCLVTGLSLSRVHVFWMYIILESFLVIPLYRKAGSEVGLWLLSCRPKHVSLKVSSNIFVLYQACQLWQRKESQTKGFKGTCFAVSTFSNNYVCLW